jgi:hypothetical protein
MTVTPVRIRVGEMARLHTDASRHPGLVFRIRGRNFRHTRRSKVNGEPAPVEDVAIRGQPSRACLQPVGRASEQVRGHGLARNGHALALATPGDGFLGQGGNIIVKPGHGTPVLLAQTALSSHGVGHTAFDDPPGGVEAWEGMGDFMRVDLREMGGEVPARPFCPEIRRR